LEVERVLPAPSSVVFAAFTDPNGLANWWGPHGFTVADVKFQAQVGQRYRITMQPPEGEPFHLSGEIREVEAPVRLVYTFVYEEPAPDDVETLVSLSFRDLGEATAVTMTQSGFKTGARRARHRDGWADSFDELERFISAEV